MSNNLTTTIGGGGNREEQPIETLNINKRKYNTNNTSNLFEINHILLSHHTVISQFNQLINL